MRIKIKVLNVADADAIIVSLSDSIKGDILLLIDGGRHSHSGLVIEHTAKEAISLGKKAPDYILCTHFDSDHIGGLLDVVKHFKNDIGHILLHKTTEYFNQIIKANTRSDESSIFPSEADCILTAEENDIVLESIKQEAELIDLIKSYNIQSSEPIAQQFSFGVWDDTIKIIGPSLGFYKTLFPNHFTPKDIVITEPLIELMSEDGNLKENENPFEAFDKLKRTKVSAPNLNSAILKIEYNGRSFLFTGDASIESFLSIDNFERELADVFWLKVPHHGSKNNLNSMLVKLFNPKYVVVSGDKLVNGTMLSCFEKLGSKVELTKRIKFLFYDFDFSI